MAMMSYGITVGDYLSMEVKYHLGTWVVIDIDKYCQHRH